MPICQIIMFTKESVDTSSFMFITILYHPFSVVGEDYTVDTATTIVYASGTSDLMRCIDITILDDDIYEENQDFSVTLQTMSPASVIVFGAPNSITKTIQDNNGPSLKLSTAQSIAIHVHTLSLCASLQTLWQNLLWTNRV